MNLGVLKHLTNTIMVDNKKEFANLNETEL